jgi:hypothetical protein
MGREKEKEGIFGASMRRKCPLSLKAQFGVGDFCQPVLRIPAHWLVK